MPQFTHYLPHKICARNFVKLKYMKCRLEIAYIMEIVKITKHAEIYGRNGRSDHAKIQSRYKVLKALKFTSQDICIIFTTNVAYDMEIIKILKFNKMSCRNARLDHAKISSRNKLKLPFIYLTRYMYDYYCKSSLQYGNCRNSKTYLNFWWKF